MNSFSQPVEHVISSICTNELRICFAMWLQLVTKHEKFPARKETSEKVRKGSTQEVSGFPCSLSATNLIVSASSFSCCAFHEIHVPQWILGASCRTCHVSSVSLSAFTQHQVWVTFLDLVRTKFAWFQRLVQVLFTLPSLPKEEEPEPCNHTWPVYEVNVPQLREGINCVCVAEAVTIHGQMGLLHSPAISCTCREFIARPAVSLNSCAALFLFVIYLAFLQGCKP